MREKVAGEMREKGKGRKEKTWGKGGKKDKENRHACCGPFFKFLYILTKKLTKANNMTYVTILRIAMNIHL